VLPFQAILGDERQNISRVPHSLMSLACLFPFDVPSSSLPHPVVDRMHGRSRELESKTPSVKIMNWEAVDKVFRERLHTTARCSLSVCNIVCGN
jgi:hypothetical protein